VDETSRILSILSQPTVFCFSLQKAEFLRRSRTFYPNSHNYLADFDSESPLYLEADKLVEQLTDWFSCEPTLPGRMEELWVMLYQRGYLGAKDVALVQAWLEVLVQSRYTFPAIANTHSSCKKL